MKKKYYFQCDQRCIQQNTLDNKEKTMIHLEKKKVQLLFRKKYEKYDDHEHANRKKN